MAKKPTDAMPAFIPTNQFLTRSTLTDSRYRHWKRNSCSIRAPARIRNNLRSTVASISEQPKRVAVVGAGISGLATALALSRTGAVKGEDIDIFETRTTADTALGGALNLTGGSAVLYHKYGIDLRSLSSPLSRVIGRSMCGRNINDMDDARVLFDFNVEDAVKRQRSKLPLLFDSEGEPLLFTVMRDEVQRVLLSETVNREGVNLHRGYSVQAVLPDGILQFTKAGGNEQSKNVEKKQYDLVIGADGVRSIVRNAVTSSSSASGQNGSSKSVYSGFRILWAIDEEADENRTNPPFGTVHQWFGDGLYLMHYGAGPPGSRQLLMAASFQDQRARVENAAYRSNSTESTRVEGTKLLSAAGLPDDLCQSFNSSTRFIDTPVYEYPMKDFSSSVHRAVLVGDAAHAMAPFLGQGANQAIQDAHVLAATIASIGQSNDDGSSISTLEEALSKYESIRRIPTQALVQSSRGVGLLETQGGLLGTTFRDNAFAFAGKTGLVQTAFLSACEPRLGQYK